MVMRVKLDLAWSLSLVVFVMINDNTNNRTEMNEVVGVDVDGYLSKTYGP
jgi:hypothetical protein